MPNSPNRQDEVAQEFTLQLLMDSLLHFFRNDYLRVRGKPVQSEPLQIPGIGTGSAYASGDAFGTTITIDVPVFGTISNVGFYDFDDEGIQKDLVIFRKPFTSTADNSEFAVSDADLLNCIGVINIVSFNNFANNQVGFSTPALSYVAPDGKLYCQMVTRGADNIAAGNVPAISIVIL